MNPKDKDELFHEVYGLELFRDPFTDENPGDLLTNFLFEQVEKLYDPGEDWRDHLGMSGINHDCERKIFYDFHWTSKSQRSGRVIRLLKRGSREEPNFYDL